MREPDHFMKTYISSTRASEYVDCYAIMICRLPISMSVAVYGSDQFRIFIEFWTPWCTVGFVRFFVTFL